jgi:formate dehydrogenase major subunit
MTTSRRDFVLHAARTAAGATLGATAATDAGAQSQSAGVPLDDKVANARVVPSVCPYCAVGCGMLVHVADGKVVNIEGNPDSPINRGTLCPKGAASFALTVNPNRPTRCLYRRPGGTDWEPIALQRAMDMVAERVKATRDRTFRRTAEIAGRTVGVNHTLGIASLGGATMDNEWNYVHAKLFRGLGGVYIENQARI